MIKLSEQIKNCRNDLGLSQDELAEKLFVTRQSVSKWELGESIPDLNNIIKLSEILNITLDELILGKKVEPLSSKRPSMTFWDFASKFWWIIFIIFGMIMAIISAIKG
ncbi:helix-turn-helix domain-containing protein [Enterococcus gilvus]|uniref:helix-turn-helix domain-containing protein n=1 Tax=Enterococcus gilvus TaxID=160453 RepID=UPI003EDAF286